MKKKSPVKKAILKEVRRDFIEAGGQDGRYKTKVVPDKKKEYKRSKAKKIKPESLEN